MSDYIAELFRAGSIHITRYTGDGRVIQCCDYGFEVGNLHVIDYHLWLAALPIRRPGFGSPTSLRFTENWTRS